MKFHTTIKQGDKTATGIQIPNDVIAALGAGKMPPVRLTVNGYTYRSTVATVDGNTRRPSRPSTSCRTATRATTCCRSPVRRSTKPASDE